MFWRSSGVLWLSTKCVSGVSWNFHRDTESHSAAQFGILLCQAITLSHGVHRRPHLRCQSCQRWSSRSQGHRQKCNMRWRWSEKSWKKMEKKWKKQENHAKPGPYPKMLCCQWVETSCNGMIHKLFQQLTLTSSVSTENISHETDWVWFFFKLVKRGNFSSIFFRRFWRIDVDGVSYMCYV